MVTEAAATYFNGGWVWFSVPLIPLPYYQDNPSMILAYDCTNRLYSWRDRSIISYPSDFQCISVGYKYMLLVGQYDQFRPLYVGARPQIPFDRDLVDVGNSWVGVPDITDNRGPTSVTLRCGLMERTAEMDYGDPEPWINWNWVYWDASADSAKIMNLFGGGDEAVLHPWRGYRVWANRLDVELVFH